MDPVTGISTAAAVLDLVTFGYKIIACAAELHSSAVGALEGNVDRDVVVRDIQFILGSLKKPDDKDGGQQLEELRKRSIKVATELSVSLNKIQIGPGASKREALIAAIRTLWKKKDIAELDGRLRGLSQELNLCLTANSRCATRMRLRAFLTNVKRSKLLDQMTAAQRAQVGKVMDAVKNTQRATMDKIDEQTDTLRSEMITQQEKTRESSAKNADNIQIRIVTETSLLRDSVAFVRDQAITIDEHLDGIEEGSQETRNLLQQVLDVGSKLDRRFQKVEKFLTQAKPDQTQTAVTLLDDAFDALAEYSQRKTNADPVCITHQKCPDRVMSVTRVRFYNH